MLSYMATNAIVTSKGQVVIPAEIRKRFGIKPGTQLSFFEDNGRLIIQPITEQFIESLAGSLKGRDLSAILRRERKRDWRP
jgi:AbrB family looped-hinge helix DNA binding protein